MEKKTGKQNNEMQRVKLKRQSGQKIDRHDCQAVGREVIDNVKSKFKNIKKAFKKG